jgi:hypothetical protein
MSGYGSLNDDHFGMLKEFWTNIHSPSSIPQSSRGVVSLVLPSGYGSGMRVPNDRIWGRWPAGNESAQIWDNTNRLVAKYGLKLDIIYEDPQFSVFGKYGQTYLWNSTATSNDLPPTFFSLPNLPFFLPILTAVLTSTFLAIILLVKRRKLAFAATH